MANLSSLEEARLEEFADDEAVREEMAKSYVMQGEHLVKFRALKAGKNPTEDKDGNELPPEKHPGEPNIRGMAVVDGTDTTLNVTFNFIQDKENKAWKLWANVLHALNKPMPRTVGEFQEITDILENEGLRWKLGLCATRGDDFEFVKSEEEAKEYIREGYDVFNYLDKRAKSARRA